MMALLATLEAKGYEITISNSLPPGAWTVRIRSGEIDFLRPPRLFVSTAGTSPLLALERAAEIAHKIEIGELRSPYGDQKPKVAPPAAASLTDMLEEEPETELEGMLS